MRHDRLTGKAAEDRPDVADLHVTYAEADIKHSTTGVRRRVRRIASVAQLRAQAKAAKA